MLRTVMEDSEVKIDKGKDVEKAPIDLHFYLLIKKNAMILSVLSFRKFRLDNP